jgi:hypothetical protein
MSEESFFNDTVEEMDFSSLNKVNKSIKKSSHLKNIQQKFNNI